MALSIVDVDLMDITCAIFHIVLWSGPVSNIFFKVISLFRRASTVGHRPTRCHAPRESL